MYDSNYMIFWKSQNYEDSKKIIGSQGLVNRWSTEGFMTVKQLCVVL